MRQETIKSLKRFFAIKWLIFSVLTLTIFFYFILTVIFKKMGMHFIDKPIDVSIIKFAFLGVSIMLLFAVFVVRLPFSDPWRFLSALKKRDFKPKQIERFTEKINDDTIKVLGGAILLSNMIDIISWALLEAIAVFGILLFFLSESMFYVQVFGGVALLMMAFCRPKFPTFIGLMEATLIEHADSISSSEVIES